MIFWKAPRGQYPADLRERRYPPRVTTEDSAKPRRLWAEVRELWRANEMHSRPGPLPRLVRPLDIEAVGRLVVLTEVVDEAPTVVVGKGEHVHTLTSEGRPRVTLPVPYLVKQHARQPRLRGSFVDAYPIAPYGRFVQAGTTTAPYSPAAGSEVVTGSWLASRRSDALTSSFLRP